MVRSSRLPAVRSRCPANRACAFLTPTRWASTRESNAAIYTIGIFAVDDVDRNPGALKSLSRATGGERFLPKSTGDLMQACERIAREIRSGYTIDYVPPDRDGSYHRVRVDVQPSSSQKLNIRTRPGYFAAGRATQPD